MFVCVAKIPAITTDSGGEISVNHILSGQIGVPTSFCDPYSALQQGTDAHLNGRIRRCLPRGTSFDDVAAVEIGEGDADPPRKVLRWLVPAEVFRAAPLPYSKC